MTKRISGMKNPMNTEMLRHVFGVLVVLLVASAVLVGAGSAEETKTYYVNVTAVGTGDGLTLENASELSDVLTTISSEDTGTYNVYLVAGTYSGNYVITRSQAAVNVILQPVSENAVVIFTGNITVYNTGVAGNVLNDETLTFKNLNFIVPNEDKAAAIATVKTPNGAHGNPGNIVVENCIFTGTAGTTQYAILGGHGTQTGNLSVINSQFTDISHTIQGRFNCAQEIIISGCTITGADTGINLQAFGDTSKTVVTISDNKITAYSIAVQLGSPETKMTAPVIIQDNTLEVTSDSGYGAVIFRGNSAESITVEENVVTAPEGVKLLVTSDLTTLPQSDQMTFATNTWNDVESAYPSPADSQFGNGQTIIPWTGDGSETNPYRITSKTDLEYLATAVNNGDSAVLGKHFKLTANIDLNNDEWTPIGSATNPFLGTFDGDNKTISNLKITGTSDYVGLFGNSWNNEKRPVVIKNVILENVDVSGGNSVGSLVGTIANSDSEPIDNCHVSGLVKVSGNNFVGGLVGYSYVGITDCTVIGETGSEVTGTGESVGGLAGLVGESADSVTDCTVDIPVNGARMVGGLIGNVGTTDTKIPEISGSSSAGKVTLTYDSTHTYADYEKSVGALIGRVDAGVVVDSSSSTSDVIVDEDFASAGIVVSAGFVGVVFDESTPGATVNDETTVNSVTVTSSTWTPSAASYEALQAAGYLQLEDKLVAAKPVSPPVQQKPSSSSSSGSSVWLTETPTDTAPTDTVPTDIPVTQPTATPESPGFGILAALAGLGAVAVLRRK